MVSTFLHLLKQEESQYTSVVKICSFAVCTKLYLFLRTHQAGRGGCEDSGFAIILDEVTYYMTHKMLLKQE